ncbi:MAG: MFS transporter [Planctomycetes bacterium]|nr:MFS transporter [Planctomycetota bacterium]
MAEGTPRGRVVRPGARWFSRGALGICVATFFSDVGHELATAVLPLYIGALGLGPAALGAIEGLADLVSALAKLGGGFAGQRLERKVRWTAAGYALTAVGTAALSLVRAPAALAALRALAWAGRGFRSPLRDHLLADEVEPSHYGRIFGLERAADMLGAVVGPLLAVVLVAWGLSAGEIIAWTILPASIPVLAIVLLVRDRPHAPAERAAPRPVEEREGPAALPADYWRLIRAVSVFGASDFSRTFLILLAARALASTPQTAAGFDAAFATGTLTAAVGLYAGHNAVSAVAAALIGRVADRLSKPKLLAAGYALAAVAHAVLILGSHSVPWLVVAIVLSGVYVAAEETLEKATCAVLVPRAARSKAFGILATANSFGDLVSSVGLGLLLAAGLDALAFGLCAVLAACGAILAARVRVPESTRSR